MPTYDSGTSGLTVGLTILNLDATEYAARTTSGITEPVAGSGVYHVEHPAVGTLLTFVWDEGVGTIGASETTDGVPMRGTDDAVTSLTPVTDAIATLDFSTLTAQQVWEYVTRELTSAGSGATAQEVWEYATRALTEKSGFSGEATNMRGTDNAATAADLAVVDGIVDDILVDTGTTLPAAVAAIPTNPLLTNDVRLDAVADIDEMLTFLTAYFSNRLTTTTNAGVRTVTLYDTDGTTPLKTWTYTVATNERSAGA